MILLCFSRSAVTHSDEEDSAESSSEDEEENVTPGTEDGYVI